MITYVNEGDNLNKKTVNLNLEGINGNAFAIMGTFAQQAKSEGWSETKIQAVLDEAKKGDYDHLLATIMSYCQYTDDL